MDKKKIRVVCFDGSDGLGKTTQLMLLKKKLENSRVSIHNTRLLGGTKECDFQMACRKVLLHKKFPNNSVELEEQLFALTDGEGIKQMRSFLEEQSEGVALKDRGLASHIVYALAKGMTLKALSLCHKDVIQAEREINSQYGMLNIIMVPDEPGFPIERIRKRSKDTGEEIVERLENIENQIRVIQGLREFKNYDIVQDMTIEVIEISESDTIQDVQLKVDKVLENYEILGV